ncbi:uncharacterized protein LOC143452595 isoform X2 [Clavelina lepadiformis]|uniref:uncharacterized protein LOC143452595 isoform X2 n=1 Tax=Clavelina lepadiformis TaxID=159417 RepID=UPI00404207C7
MGNLGFRLEFRFAELEALYKPRMLSLTALLSQACHAVSVAVTMQAGKEQELKLAAKLKTELCDRHGREKNPVECAEIFHKIGVIYMNRAHLTQDKLCFIQSATLLNAAIVRDPENKAKVEDDLNTLSRCLLKAANAEGDILRESRRVKERVEKMRDDAKSELKKSENMPENAEGDELRQLEESKIARIQKIMEKVTNDFKAIMKGIAEFCSDIMGESPCDYALAGMGSLARGDVTPYSDFQSLIVLQEGVQYWPNYEAILEYYRWFFVIFQVVLINLGETVIPFAAIPTLNDLNPANGCWYRDICTKNGIFAHAFDPYASNDHLDSFFAAETPSFATILIEPPSSLADYLHSSGNGQDDISCSCHVAGSVAVYEEFENQVRVKLSSEDTTASGIRDHIKKCLEHLGMRNQLFYASDSEGCDVKKVIYRSLSVFISALGRLFRLKAASCFEITLQLSRHGLSEEFAHKLNYALAVACEVLMKVYCEKEAHDGWVDEWSMEISEVGELSQTVGAKSLIDFFLITHSLQCDFAKYFQISLTDFYGNPEVLVTLANCYLRRFEKAVHFGTVFLSNDSSESPVQDLTLDTSIFGRSYSKIQQYLDIAKGIMAPGLSQSFVELVSPSRDNADTMHAMSKCLIRLFMFKEALLLSEHELTVRNKLPEYQKKAADKASWLNIRGLIWNELGESKQSLLEVKKSLNAFATLDNEDKIKFEIVLHLNVGVLCQAQQQSDEAITLNMKQNLIGDIRADKDAAIICCNLGQCLVALNRLSEALSYFQQGLEIWKKVDEAVFKDDLMRRFTSGIKFCSASGFKDSFQYKYALEIQKERSKHIEDVSTDASMDTGSVYWQSYGSCLKNMKLYVEALHAFNNELRLRKQTSLNENTDNNLANCFNHTGICLDNLKEHEKALERYEQALEIMKRISPNANKDINIAAVFANAGVCLGNLKKHKNAFKMIENALEIQKKVLSHRSTENLVVDYLRLIKILLRNFEQQNKIEETPAVVKKIFPDADTDARFANLSIFSENYENRNKVLKKIHNELEMQKKILSQKSADSHVIERLILIENFLNNLKQHEKVLEASKEANRSEPSESDEEPFEYMPVQTTDVVGNKGGRVEFEGCVIEIPEGAMNENMFFVFTLIYDDEEENIDKMKLTPTLKCSPSYKFEKPVTITLPTCYLPDKSDVLVTPRTHDGKDWRPLGNVPHHDKYSLSFETMSFCGKDFVGNRSDFSSKRLLFKCSMVHKNSRNPHINWWILSYMGQNTAENRGQRCFIGEVRSDQNLILKLTSDNVVFDHRESVIDSSELFRHPTKVRRQFSICQADYSMILEEDSSFDFEIVAENTGIQLHEGNISLASLSATETTASPDECDFNGNQVTVDSASQDVYEHHLDNDNIYKVVQKPKAHVLFLYNTRFPTWPTEADLRQIEPTLDLLRQLFQGLGCEVNVRPNLKAHEMRQTITNFSRDDQHTDFCVLFIISHGGHISGQDVVYGTDGDYLTISEVVNNFTPNNPSLLEKPKLLFFHCCRGGVIDIGVRPATLPTAPHSDLEQEIERLLEEYERHHPDNSNNIPRSLHIATVQSTLEGYVSSFGRFFFAVVNVFSRNAKDDHFMDLMTKVTRAMGRRTPQLSRQLPVVVSHLDKSLYFFPGCDY